MFYVIVRTELAWQDVSTFWARNETTNHERSRERALRTPQARIAPLRFQQSRTGNRQCRLHWPCRVHQEESLSVVVTFLPAPLDNKLILPQCCLYIFCNISLGVPSNANWRSSCVKIFVAPSDSLSCMKTFEFSRSTILQATLSKILHQRM